LRQPIIMLTVQQEDMDKVLGLEMGADDYVTKPFSLKELLSRIRAQLRRAYGSLAGAQGGLLYAGDVVIDRERGQVTVGNQKTNLTPTEFRLLTFLALHPNQVLSRGQLLEAVWGYDSTPESEQIIKVNIRRLREKVELDPANPKLIQTIPGIGYRLVCE
jgi:DNA-binding response OmpR family regulator